LVRERLLDWAMRIVEAEEMARSRVEVEVKPKPAPVERVRSLVWHGRSVPFGTLIDESGCGVLRELVVKNGDKYFGLEVVVDGVYVYHKSWDEFNAISEYVDEVAAFEDDGTYILHLSDIKFSSMIKVVLRPVTVRPLSSTVSEVFYKIELRT